MLKSEIIKGAYEELRISGITVNPGKEDNEMALRKLEGFCAEFEKRDMCLGYNFEDRPDMNSPSGIDKGHWDSVQIVLGTKLISHFGKVMTPDFKLKSDAAFSFMTSSTAQVNEVQYPSRQPIGSGNNVRFGTFRRKYYPEIENVPADCSTRTLFRDGVEDYTEHYDTYLIGDAEDITSYVLTAENGLTVTDEDLETPDVTYRVTADKVGTWKLKIVATTSTGRVNTRIHTYVIKDSDI